MFLRFVYDQLRSNVFPRNALSATVLDALLYFFLRVIRQFNDLNITQIISSENGRAQIQTGFTIFAVTQVDYWNFHFMTTLLTAKQNSVRTSICSVHF
jgi:hypothetical protein